LQEREKELRYFSEDRSGAFPWASILFNLLQKSGAYPDTADDANQKLTLMLQGFFNIYAAEGHYRRKERFGCKRMWKYIAGGVLLLLAVLLVVQGIRCSIAVKESKERLAAYGAETVQLSYGSI
jgi:hypothetical protein